MEYYEAVITSEILKNINESLKAKRLLRERNKINTIEFHLYEFCL